jgi:hypothetical protein
VRLRSAAAERQAEQFDHESIEEENNHAENECRQHESGKSWPIRRPGQPSSVDRQLGQA